MGIVLVCSAGILTGAAEAGKPRRNRARYETFETRVFLPVPPERVWELIERMDKVEADKPFLIRIGLPKPVRCELEGESVGGSEVIRKSGISSRLYPRWYWRPLEAWDVQSEHD